MLNSPTLLNTKHKCSSFDCGVSSLNRYLKQHALQNIKNRSSRTYVFIENNHVYGYYSIAYGSVEHEQAPARILKGLGKYPVPIMLLARLAVDLSYQNKGLGKGLLKDALLRTLQAADIAGLRAMLVHAKDNEAKSFYQKFGFMPSHIDEMHLFLLMKDMKEIVQI